MQLLKIPKPLVWISTAVVLSGCLTHSKEVILPQTGATMQAVYEQHFRGRTASDQVEQHREPLGHRPVGDDASDLKGYTRESYNETRLLFKRLPNPDLVMYVFPHLTAPLRQPIPGYTTAFPFYETVEYALPGEVEE